MPPPRSWGASTPQSKPMAKPPSATAVQPGGGHAQGASPRCPDGSGGGSGHLPRRPPAGSQPGPMGPGTQMTPPPAAQTGFFVAPLYGGMRRGASPADGQPPPAADAPDPGRPLLGADAAPAAAASPTPAAAPPTPAAPAAAVALSQGNQQATDGGGAPKSAASLGGVLGVSRWSFGRGSPIRFTPVRRMTTIRGGDGATVVGPARCFAGTNRWGLLMTSVPARPRTNL